MIILILLTGPKPGYHFTIPIYHPLSAKTISPRIKKPPSLWPTNSGEPKTKNRKHSDSRLKKNANRANSEKTLEQ